MNVKLIYHCKKYSYQIISWKSQLVSIFLVVFQIERIENILVHWIVYVTISIVIWDNVFMILIEENVYVVMDEKVIDECQQGNNCSKEQSICEDHIDICQYHQTSLENSKFNSNSIYDRGETEEVKAFLLVNFLFLDFHIPFLFVMISERVFHFSIEQINDTNASIFP